MHVICQLCTIFLLTLIPLFGIFFGLDYQEIREFSFIPIKCMVLKSSIVPRNCCSYGCGTSYLTCASTSAGSCSSVINYAQSLRPDQCLSDPRQCFQQGSSCSGSYYCCHTSCSVCKTCKLDQNGKQICTNYDCNCYCSLYTFNLACKVTCSNCYNGSVQMSYTFNDIVYEPVRVYDFNSDLNSAQNLINKYAKDTEHVCWVNGNDPNEFVYEIGYTPWKWIIFGLSCIGPLVCMWIFNYIICKNILQNFYHNRIVVNIDIHEWSAAISTTIIFGLIVPLTIFLPISLFGLLDQTASYAVTMSFLVTLVFGNIWLSLLLLIDIIGIKLLHGSLFYIFGVVIPICVLVPISLWIPKTSLIITILLIITISSSVISIIVYKYANRPKYAIAIPVAETIQTQNDQQTQNEQIQNDQNQQTYSQQQEFENMRYYDVEAATMQTSKNNST